MKTQPETRPVDIHVENHGSLFLFRPDTTLGRRWLAENVPEGLEHLYCGGALVVEPRHAQATAIVMCDDGLYLE